ncbi:hypothetical protein THAOC_04245 [Thalassiosira oceanica]|uniref:DDE Tnp4 domain-containing protein n=1 Tax=Thalassiosira oceanica TaxID=159749 RepID=K0TAG5_THAOC|nr:hypothetical protein THAOC_04245 [Thalassiosira oceanica]|eukprot:EJK74099.1 hypothetical protein THAOC_04245 [Thalassiosira oceanica]
MTDHHALYTRFLQSEASAEEEASLRKANFAAHVASVLANAAAFVSNSADSARKRKAPESNHAGRPAGTKTKRRERTDMSKYLGGLDDRAFRRKYRMDKQSFFDLLDIIKGKMPSDGTVRKRGATPNGAITHSISGSSFATTYCLFGDNAYVQSPYMVVPWRKVGAGAKDAYNFYQSQLRINIECAFGMLVHRWGMLRKPVPNNITVLRTTRLVLALCKLHNYCITRRVTIDRPQDGDVSNIVLDGGLALPRFDQNSDAAWEYDNEADRLNGILDGGQHTDDHTRAQREEFSKRRGLPAQFFLNFVKDNGLRRPDRSTFRRL